MIFQRPTPVLHPTPRLSYGKLTNIRVVIDPRGRRGSRKDRSTTWQTPSSRSTGGIYWETSPYGRGSGNCWATRTVVGLSSRTTCPTSSTRGGVPEVDSGKLPTGRSRVHSESWLSPTGFGKVHPFDSLSKSRSVRPEWEPRRRTWPGCRESTLHPPPGPFLCRELHFRLDFGPLNLVHLCSSTQPSRMGSHVQFYFNYSVLVQLLSYTPVRVTEYGQWGHETLRCRPLRELWSSSSDRTCSITLGQRLFIFIL